MQLTSLKSKLSLTLPLVALMLVGSSHISMAKGKGGKGAGKSTLSKKVQANLEVAMGKPMTVGQKSAVEDATKERQDAMKEATEKFDAAVAKATGLSPAEVEAATKKTKKKNEKKGATA